jgi:hypothetical protein
VLAYGKTQAVSRCQSDGGSVDTRSRIDSLDTSTLRLTAVDPGTGRVAMVMATSTVDPLKALQAQDQPFVAQLRLNNP